MDTSHLILHCPATDSLRRSGPDPGELPGFWGSMVFRHAPIPRKGSGNQQQQILAFGLMVLIYRTIRAKIQNCDGPLLYSSISLTVHAYFSASQRNRSFRESNEELCLPKAETITAPPGRNQPKAIYDSGSNYASQEMKKIECQFDCCRNKSSYSCQTRRRICRGKHAAEKPSCEV